MTPVETADHDACTRNLSFLGFMLMKGGDLMACVLFPLFHPAQEQRQDRIREQRPGCRRACRGTAPGMQRGAGGAVHGAAGRPGRLGKGPPLPGPGRPGSSPRLRLLVGLSVAGAPGPHGKRIRRVGVTALQQSSIYGH